MQYIELPPTVTIGAGHDVPAIALLISRVVGLDAVFGHCEPVHGTSRTGRILASKPTRSSSPLSRPYRRFDAAVELERLTLEREARYDPFNPPRQGFVKGWEICSIQLPNERGILAWACWVPR